MLCSCTLRVLWDKMQPCVHQMLVLVNISAFAPQSQEEEFPVTSILETNQYIFRCYQLVQIFPELRFCIILDHKFVCWCIDLVRRNHSLVFALLVHFLRFLELSLLISIKLIYSLRESSFHLVSTTGFSPHSWPGYASQSVTVARI